MRPIGRNFALVLVCVALGCGGTGNTASTSSTSPEDATTMELKTGGIYATKNEQGKYTLTKVLALDDNAVHVRFYNEEFDDLPTDISSDGLTYLIGHAPMAREGFLSEHPILVAVETVSDSELEGYRLYLEAMRGN